MLANSDICSPFKKMLPLLINLTAWRCWCGSWIGVYEQTQG